MTSRVTQIAVLGSTGSIGRNALEVIAASEGALRAVALAARRNLPLLEEQARQFRPTWIAATDGQLAAQHDWSALDSTKLLLGDEALQRIASDPQVDIVLSAIVGRAGLEGTWAGRGGRQNGGLGQQRKPGRRRTADYAAGPAAPGHPPARR